MEAKIQKYEQDSRSLDPDSGLREELLSHVINFANNYLESIDWNLANFRIDKYNGADLRDSPITDEGITIEEALDLIEKNVNMSGVNPTSGRHLGYIPGGGLFHAALGDYLAAITNRYAGLFSMNPGAVRVENMLLRWMAKVIGYPPDASAGNLASGGSLATLTAIVTARDAFNICQGDIPKAVCYTTDQTHQCVKRALRIAGLGGRNREKELAIPDDYGWRLSKPGGCVVREVNIDGNYRMDAEALEQAIIKDKKDGLVPWLVVASAGTVYTGAVDPLLKIGEIASAQRLWFHVDGAYGGMFMLCREGKAALKGIHLSDSVVLDPHKSLFLPYGSGVILVRKKEQLYEAFQINNDEAPYLQNTDSLADGAGELSSSNLSPELTKHFRGLRLWLPLKLLGVAPFRAALSEKLWLAKYFYERIGSMPGFKIGPPPDLSVVSFHYHPRQINDSEFDKLNEFNLKLMDSIQKDGRIYITSTKVDRTRTEDGPGEGKVRLRAAILNYRTHLDEINETIGILGRKAKELEKEWRG